ncbi:glycoside hydrolase family 31 protein [Bacteroides oleiciplenus]|uniref:DUF5110 domain-containing protein n=1 Tax=Bacteroides oleiciplenus TaxID=626931 RepID=A0A3E5BG33_9BACE|nr:TIM-barrel domain-containing protein [Bacteroides oleiciplenus]RGN36550.1 DUF5110 domain-containing protein [Bacteroides oleiciplenus]
MKRIITLLLCATLCGQIVKSQEFRKTDLGIKTNVQYMDLEIQFYNPSTVRVFKTPEKSTVKKESLSVIKSPEKVQLDIKQADDVISVQSTSLVVQVNIKTGKVSFADKLGKQLFTEKEYGAQLSLFNDAGNKTYRVKQAFLLDKDEAIYGLGQQQGNELNQRNRQYFMRQRSMYVSIPIIQSTKGYGMFWDNYSATTYTDNSLEMSFDSQVGEGIDYYFMYGGNADGVIAQIRDLTGQAPMFPLWTFGFFQSRERYESQEQLMEVVDKYRELGVPLDCIIQDWQYWGPNSNWNSMNFDNPKFPEPQKMIDHVHKKNAKILISVWPSFGPDTEQYNELEKMNATFEFTTWPSKNKGAAKVYDAFNPKARDLYWSYLKKNLLSKGIDGWWTDGTEPDHLYVQDKDFDELTALGTYRSVLNAFPLMTNGGIYTNQRNVSSDKRVYMLTRCAFAGSQRYGINMWSGDINGTWNVLKAQIPTGLNFSMTGIPYWNTDIGGFFPTAYEGSISNKAYQELYIRWFQYATFTPMLRSHGTEAKKEIYNLGKKGDWSYDTEEKYIHLRYALLPYMYSTGWQVTSNSGTFLRPLFMDFNEDTKVHNINNQYMFGKAFLVTPVTEPMYVSSTEKKWANPKENFSVVRTQDVYLPIGSKWIDFWTGEIFNGGQTVRKAVPIEIIPLYVRAGSIVPFGPRVQYSTEKKWDNLEIRVYPGANGEFVLYEDENDNYNYENGAYSTIKFTWNDANRTLTIADCEGKFPTMLKLRKFNIVVVDTQNGIGSIQSSKFTKSVSYNGKEKNIKL